MNKITLGLRDKVVDILATAIDNRIDGAELTKGLDKKLDDKLGNKLSEHLQRGVGTNTLLEMGAGFWSENPQEWADRLDVTVSRVQLRPMSTKWGSISTAGTLTLATDLTVLPKRLVDYIICHELLHLKAPHHNRAYHLLLSQHIPDWGERERELAEWVLVTGGSTES